MSAWSGNQTSAPVQALDYKSNSLALASDICLMLLEWVNLHIGHRLFKLNPFPFILQASVWLTRSCQLISNKHLTNCWNDHKAWPIDICLQFKQNCLVTMSKRLVKLWKGQSQSWLLMFELRQKELNKGNVFGLHCLGMVKVLRHLEIQNEKEIKDKTHAIKSWKVGLKNW